MSENDKRVKCFACGQPVLPMSSLGVSKTENIALCNQHWNWWIARWLNAEDEPPCGAHLITDTEGNES
ncbi:hypothetical protein [Cryobacterium sp. GrIS_2_6]|uniref:hypothetical protein n=1 Tax=Cryobacterium sp. GrIS_2_6 TaxID=3162785 RepID=UPI002E015D61|nr:hypothetical protein [Cryobacterium psychrotolerans]MEC5149258.1 hypothetical protein [Cryobacterium psychrotolerans]MEC5149337.1 hypothetical protein [Cryobacterium psychrotolerans]